MADILIKGMEMPEGCEYCPMKEKHISPVEYNLRCPIADKWVSGCVEARKRPSWCPLEEV